MMLHLFIGVSLGPSTGVPATKGSVVKISVEGSAMSTRPHPSGSEEPRNEGNQEKMELPILGTPPCRL